MDVRRFGSCPEVMDVHPFGSWISARHLPEHLHGCQRDVRSKTCSFGCFFFLDQTVRLQDLEPGCGNPRCYPPPPPPDKAPRHSPTLYGNVQECTGKFLGAGGAGGGFIKHPGLPNPTLLKDVPRSPAQVEAQKPIQNPEIPKTPHSHQLFQ